MTTDHIPDRQLELARQRTEAAQQRTQLAEQRTFSAWVRTGLASLATGLAIAKLMGDAGPTWLLRTLGTLFVVIGGAMFALAYGAYCRSTGSLTGPSAVGIPAWMILTLTVALLVGTAVGLALVFLD